MRYSLLQMTQRILESMESDEVSSIHETPESTSVANIIKECYFDIIGDLGVAEEEGLFRLDASTDNTKPCLMYIPSGISNIQWLKYQKGSDVNPTEYLRYLPQDEFLFYSQSRTTSDSNISSMEVEMNGKVFVFTYYTDRFPSSYTIFNDKYVIFDAIDLSEEVTLTESRSLVFASLVPTFEFEDNFVPNLDPRQFQLLLNEAKSLAFVELKQTSHPIADRKARKNKILAQKQKNDNDPAWSNQAHVGFGRNGRNGFPRNTMQRAMRRGV